MCENYYKAKHRKQFMYKDMQYLHTNHTTIIAKPIKQLSVECVT